MSDSFQRPLATILVVDDTDIVLQTVVAFRANYRVLAANSGPAAIKIAEQTEGVIDLLLYDIDMPKLSVSFR